ncbi:hypothetical protein P4U43_00455 [Arthrobacter sp. EH-1B-1]|uniref:Uncharacterized protein n=1 Tax=Arthrobacter vasquezii TaxID=2977629 RepID=A0ABT6CQ47_9MICC|nr:hypothetical protein [Arthrobacter vasquezii]MDF9276259.1 hypothetical protein [Arthrobacter vasquezii]
MKQLFSSSFGLAALVFLFGFAALALFATFGTFDPDLRNLWSFRSATWGDGLMLPLLALALTTMNRSMEVPANPRLRAVSVLVGALLGLAVIVGWLTDPKADLNWTMPAAHTLNFVGMWHAVFLIAATALFVTLWVEFFDRLRRSLGSKFQTEVQRGVTVLRSGHFALAIGASCAYAALAGFDNRPLSETQAGQTSLLFLAAGASVLFVGTMCAAYRKAVLAVVASLIGAVLVGGPLYLLGSSESINAVVCSFLVAAASYGFAFAMTDVIRKSTQQDDVSLRDQFFSLELVVLPSLVLLVPLAATTPRLQEKLGLWPVIGAGVVIAMGLSVGVRYWNRRRLDKDDWPWFAVCALFVILGSLALALAEANDPQTTGPTISLSFALLAALLAGPALRLCDIDMSAMIKLEKESPNEHSDAAAQRRHVRTKTALLTRMIVCGIGAATSVLGLTLLTAYGPQWRPGEAGLTANTFYWAALGLASVVLITMHVVARKVDGDSSSPRWGMRIAGLLVVFITSVILVVGGFESFNRGIDLWAAVQSLLIAAFAFECVLSNGIRLGLARLGGTSVFMLLASTSAVFVLVYWTLTTGVGSIEEPISLLASALALAATYLVVALLTVVSTMVIHGRGAKRNRTAKERCGDAWQDAGMLAPMWLLMAWLPHLIDAHVAQQQNPADRWVIMSLIFIGFLGLYISALLWLIKTNDGHVGRKHEKYSVEMPAYCQESASHLTRLRSLFGRTKEYISGCESTDEDERYLHALRTHTAAQSVYAWLLVGLTAMGGVWAALRITELDGPSVFPGAGEGTDG